MKSKKHSRLSKSYCSFGYPPQFDLLCKSFPSLTQPLLNQLMISVGPNTNSYVYFKGRSLPSKGKEKPLILTTTTFKTFQSFWILQSSFLCEECDCGGMGIATELVKHMWKALSKNSVTRCALGEKEETAQNTNVFYQFATTTIIELQTTSGLNLWSILVLEIEHLVLTVKHGMDTDYCVEVCESEIYV